MDPISIAVAAVTYVAGEIAGTGLKELGKDIYGKIKEIFQPEEIVTLDLMEKYPKSEELKSEVTEKLTKHLEANTEIAKALEELTKQIPQVTKTNTMTQTGDGNVGVQDVSGTVNINK